MTPLKFLPSKGKIFLDPINYFAARHEIDILIDCGNLSSTVEEPVNLGRVAISNMREKLYRPSETRTNKTLDNPACLLDKKDEQLGFRIILGA